MIRLLMIISGVLWFGTFLSLCGSAARLLKGGPCRYDLMRAQFAFMGLLMAGYTMRWVAFPQAIHGMDSLELQVWTVLYTLSAALAVSTLIVARTYGRGDVL